MNKSYKTEKEGKTRDSFFGVTPKDRHTMWPNKLELSFPCPLVHEEPHDALCGRPRTSNYLWLCVFFHHNITRGYRTHVLKQSSKPTSENSMNRSTTTTSVVSTFIPMCMFGSIIQALKAYSVTSAHLAITLHHSLHGRATNHWITHVLTKVPLT